MPHEDRRYPTLFIVLMEQQAICWLRFRPCTLTEESNSFCIRCCNNWLWPGPVKTAKDFEVLPFQHLTDSEHEALQACMRSCMQEVFVSIAIHACNKLRPPFRKLLPAGSTSFGICCKILCGLCSAMSILYRSVATFCCCYAGHSHSVECAEFDPTGEQLFTLDISNRVRLWHVDSARSRGELAHGASVAHASFAPDGASLLTATHDIHELTCWSLSSLQQTAVLKVSPAPAMRR